MENREEIRSLLNELVTAIEKIESDATEQQHTMAPIIVRQRLCHELVVVATANPNKILKEVPEAMDILNAIDVLDKFYYGFKGVV